MAYDDACTKKLRLTGVLFPRQAMEVRKLYTLVISRNVSPFGEKCCPNSYLLCVIANYIAKTSHCPQCFGIAENTHACSNLLQFLNPAFNAGSNCLAQ
jgi:hypothetical protein